jgi:hypothetical protein
LEYKRSLRGDYPMKRLAYIMITLLMVLCLPACYDSDSYNNKSAGFLVKTAYEFHKEIPNLYKWDLVIPKVSDEVPGGEIINERLYELYGSLEDWEERWEATTLEPKDYSLHSMSKYYSLSNKDGICSLDIINRDISSTDGTEIKRGYIHSIYYDENTGEVIDQAEYLFKLGYTLDDIKKIFIEEHKEDYGKYMDSYEHLLENLYFYFDEENNLQFMTDEVDIALANYAEFMLNVEGKLFGLHSTSDFPSLSLQDTEVLDYDNIWDNTHWIREYYEGVELTYLVNEEEDMKYAYGIEITGDSAKEICTHRGIKIGDSLIDLLNAYPEIDPSEQVEVYGTDDFLTYPFGIFGYTIEFYFKDEIIDKIALIDYFN